MKQTVRANPERGGIISKLIVLICFAAFCGLLYLLRGPILSYAGELWVVDEPPATSDALVVLGDDNYYADRSTRAAELFREGRSNLVVESGRRLRPGAGICELMQHDLVERGVPKENLLCVAHNSDNTREEAEALARVALERKWKRIIVVTSNYHTRRARYIFRKIFPQQVEIAVSSARDGDFDPAHWWENRKSFKELAKELAGMAVAIWELRSSGPAGRSSESGGDR